MDLRGEKVRTLYRAIGTYENFPRYVWAESEEEAALQAMHDAVETHDPDHAPNPQFLEWTADEVQWPYPDDGPIGEDILEIAADDAALALWHDIRQKEQNWGYVHGTWRNKATPEVKK